MSYIDQWRKARHFELKSTFGDLALEALIEIQEQATFEHIPGVWKPNLEVGTGLIVELSLEDELCNQAGELVSGEIKLATDENYIVDQYRYLMATAQPHSPYLLAIYNARHEAISRFSHIDNFDYKEEHVYIGRYKETDEQTFMFKHTSDLSSGRHESGRLHESNAIIEVTIAGEHYQLRPFSSGKNDIIVFKDATSGQQSYGVGRMLVAEKLDNGTVRLDFNQAFLPPCAFSPHFNCPMPPLHNRIKSAIDAGEKQAVWKV